MSRSILIGPDELAQRLKSNSTSSRTLPICAAWFLPNDPQKRIGRKVYEQKHIPGALFFDLDEVKDDQSPYPHMLPQPKKFASAMSEMGIKREDRIVVYDDEDLGIFSAPRVAWTFKLFGHPDVEILNNFKLWTDKGLPVESGAGKQLEKSQYPEPTLDVSRVVAYEDVSALVKDTLAGQSTDVQIIDLRSTGRFDGTAPEPRPGLSSGHMPGSTNIPLSELLDPSTKAYLSADKLRETFEKHGIDEGRPIVCSCGTGVMAAALDVALEEASFGDLAKRRVYDGSWTEYAMRADPSMILKKQS